MSALRRVLTPEHQHGGRQADTTASVHASFPHRVARKDQRRLTRYPHGQTCLSTRHRSPTSGQECPPSGGCSLLSTNTVGSTGGHCCQHPCFLSTPRGAADQRRLTRYPHSQTYLSIRHPIAAPTRCGGQADTTASVLRPPQRGRTSAASPAIHTVKHPSTRHRSPTSGQECPPSGGCSLLSTNSGAAAFCGHCCQHPCFLSTPRGAEGPAPPRAAIRTVKHTCPFDTNRRIADKSVRPPEGAHS